MKGIATSPCKSRPQRQKKLSKSGQSGWGRGQKNSAELGVNSSQNDVSSVQNLGGTALREDFQQLMEAERVERAREMKEVNDKLEMIKQVTMENQKISREVRTGVSNIGQGIHLIRLAAELFACLMKRLENTTQALQKLREAHKQNFRQIEMDEDESVNTNATPNKRDRSEVCGGRKKWQIIVKNEGQTMKSRVKGLKHR